MARQKGHGTLVRVKAKGNKFYYFARFVVDGKPTKISLGIVSKSEAEKKLEELYRQREGFVRKGDEIAEAVKAETAEEVAIADLFTAFTNAAETRSLSIGTLRIAASKIKTFQKWMFTNRAEKKYVSQVEVEDLKEFVAGLSAGRSAETVKSFIKIHRRLWSLLGRDEKKNNPWQSMKWESASSTAKKAVTVEDVSRILASAETETEKTLVMLLAFTGMRLVDCLSLKWSEIDLGNGTVKHEARKTKGRTRATEKPLANDLHVYLRGLAKDGAFVLGAFAEKCLKKREYIKGGEKRTELEFDVHKAERELNKVLVRAGYRTEGKGRQDFAAHSFRHGYISTMLSNGIEVATVAKLADHSNIQQTMNYYNGSILSVRAAVDKAFNGISLKGLDKAEASKTLRHMRETLARLEAEYAAEYSENEDNQLLEVIG